MRIRSIKPAFWEDAKVAALPVGARLFFIGLWNLADDRGYLRWSVSEVAAALYRYEHVRRRERLVGEYMEALVKAGMAQLMPCGIHALVPHLSDHQRLAGEASQVKTFEREHQVCEGRFEFAPAEARTPPPRPAAPRKSPPSRARVGDGDRGVSPSEKEGDRGGAGGNPPLASQRGIPEPPPRPDVDVLLERWPKVSIKQAEMLAEVAQYEQATLADKLSGYQVVAGWIREAFGAGLDPIEHVLATGKQRRAQREAANGSPKPKPRRRSGSGESVGSVLGRVLPEAPA